MSCFPLSLLDISHLETLLDWTSNPGRVWSGVVDSSALLRHLFFAHLVGLLKEIQTRYDCMELDHLELRDWNAT